MSTDALYRRLQRHLDRMPIGFPASASGLDIRILQQLFTPDEARIALELSALPEPAGTISKRLRGQMTLPELEQKLTEMAAKGVILSIPGKQGTRYGKLMFAIGMFENQVNRLTPQFARDALQYLKEEFGSAFHTKKTTQMRVAPVNKTIPVERNVSTHDDIRAFIEACEGPFAKLPCICRRAKDMLGAPCRQTHLRDNCLTAGPAARFAVDRAGAQFISKEEMLRLLDAADEEGLVLQPQNTKQPFFICCCCGCCCGVLGSAKQLPSPAEYFSSNYYADVDADTCQSCGTCEPRCQMDAISTVDGKTVVDRTRCIGCGLCITTCPSGALRLEKKEATRVPPDDARALYLKILDDRYGPWGKTGIAARKLLGMKI